MAGSKALETSLLLPGIDAAACSDILQGSSLAEFPHVAMLELSSVVAFVLVIRKYAPSTRRATAATPPATKPIICEVFHLGFCTFPVLEGADGGILSGDTCWSAGLEVMTGSRTVSDVVAFVSVFLDEVIVVVSWPGSDVFVSQTIVVDTGMVVLLSASSPEVVDVSEAVVVEPIREYKRVALAPPHA